MLRLIRHFIPYHLPLTLHAAYYFAHANTSPKVTTTLGDVPRLLSTNATASSAALSSSSSTRAERKLTKYSFYDDGADVVVLCDFEEATLSSLAVDAVTTTNGVDWFELRIALTDHDVVLRLSGLAGRIESTRARKGKARVTLRLQKSEAGEWTTLLAKQVAAAASGGGGGEVLGSGNAFEDA